MQKKKKKSDQFFLITEKSLKGYRNGVRAHLEKPETSRLPFKHSNNNFINHTKQELLWKEAYIFIYLMKHCR